MPNLNHCLDCDKPYTNRGLVCTDCGNQTYVNEGCCMKHRFGTKKPEYQYMNQLFEDNSSQKSTKSKSKDLKNKLNRFKHLESGINDLFIYLENNY